MIKLKNIKVYTETVGETVTIEFPNSDRLPITATVGENGYAEFTGVEGSEYEITAQNNVITKINVAEIPAEESK